MWIFLYRDLSHIREVIERCVRGEVDAVYQLGHPIGFQNQIYVGETYFGRPLYETAGELSALKKLVGQYPPRMRRALIASICSMRNLRSISRSGPQIEVTLSM